jgi:hypothetical protein
MDVFGHEDLRTLVEERDGPCISLYQPTHRAGPDTRSYAQEDPIRFRNLLREAERRLTADGLRAREVHQLLEPPRQLIDDAAFWQHQAEGLATFIAPDLLRTFRVPLRFDELVVVAPRFQLKPLLALLTGDGLFHVLALSQNQVRFLACTRATVDPVPLGGPQSLAEALQYDDPERQLQLHTGTPQAGDRRAAMFHGHGGAADDAKANLLRFFQQIDRAVVSHLKKAAVPLVVAGVDYLHPLYREANTHPQLLSEGISGNPEGLRPEELHARAWPLVRPHFEGAREAAAARYRERRGTGKTVTEVSEVVLAARDGRVEVLFAAVGIRIWGTFAADARTVQITGEEGGPNEDLLNLAAIHTILHRGTVYAVPPSEMPEAGAAAAAVLRF